MKIIIESYFFPVTEVHENSTKTSEEVFIETINLLSPEPSKDTEINVC